MTDSYDDIIDLPHYEPRHHARMPMSARAAQFAPFAALNGHEEAIAETARFTVAQQDLGEDDLRELDRKLARVLAGIDEQPQVEVVYFVPDDRKAGGSYRHYRGRLRRLESAEGLLVFAEGVTLPLRSLLDIRPISYE